MRTIGLLGGMSWESTLSYYQAINRGIAKRLGGLHSAKLVLVSLDFSEIEQLQAIGDWEAASKILIQGAQQLKAAGAECILICTNTMHKLAPEIEQALDLPLLHIADATGAALVAHKHQRVALLGTAFTMEQDFYSGRLRENFGLDVIIPESEDRQRVHQVIYEELCQGKRLESSKQDYLAIIQRLQENGAEAVILGCTEIALLIQQKDCELPLFDTTQLHAEQAIQFSLSAPSL